MNYREFKISDYPAAMALWQQNAGIGLRNADSPEGISKYLERNPGLSFVAEIDDQVIGTIMSGHDGKRGYLQHLAVDEKYRRMGTGEHLVTLALDALKAQGILKSHIMVYAHNTLGKQFWLNRGWQERSDLLICSYVNSHDENV